MRNLIIALIAIIVIPVTAVSSYYFGLWNGQEKMNAEETAIIQNKIQAETIERLNQNPPETFGRAIPEVLTATLKDIKTNSLIVTLRPRSIEEAVKYENREASLLLNKDTKIYFQKILTSGDPTAATMFEDYNVALNDLKIGETLVAQIDPADFEKTEIPVTKIIVSER